MPTATNRLVHAFLAVVAILLAAPTASSGASIGDPFPGFTPFAQHAGPATGQESATDVAVQADGKIVTSILNDGEVDQRIVRLLPGGDLDATFGVGGVWHVPSAGTSYIRSIAVQPDGKIVYAGVDTSLPGIVLGRLTPAGEPDITFSGDGRYVIATPQGSDPLVEDVLIEPSGKITFVGVVRNGARADDLFIGRLSPFGVDDPDFAGDPYLVFGSPYDGEEDRFGGIARMPNGDYIVGNPHAVSASMVWRINSTGTTRVAANVAFPKGFGDPVDIMATDATHAVVLLEGSQKTGLAYLDVSATPVISQDAGNAGTVQPFPASFRGHELLRQPDGRFFVSGIDSTMGNHRAIMRLNANGTPDASWSPGGIKHLEGGSTPRFYLDRQSLALMPDGSLVSAYHALAGGIRQTRVERFVARIARVRAEVVAPLAKGTVGVPVEYTVRAVNDGPDASGAGTFAFSVSDGLRITSWTGRDCTVDARGGSCRFGVLDAGASRSIVIRVKALSRGNHAVNAVVNAVTYDDDRSDDATSTVHPFEPAAVAPILAPAPAPAAANPPPNTGATTAPKVLGLTLQRITGYGGRVMGACATVRAMCIVDRARTGVRLVPAYLRASAGIQGRRTVLLVMQVQTRDRWIVKYRHRLPLGANGGLDIKLPSNWRANPAKWRMRTETIARQGAKPKVSGWMFFQVR